VIHAGGSFGIDRLVLEWDTDAKREH